MTRKELAKDIYSTSHLTGEFLLRSGTISNEYFDKYKFEANPKLLFAICKEIANFIPEDTELLAGLEMGGIPIATILSQITNIPVAFIRKKAKEYGTCNLAEGTTIKDKKVLIVEDVITSAGQVVISSAELRKLGAEISNAVCVIDREAGGKDNLTQKGIELKSLFTMSEIKELAIE